jgi:hypothetical protein
MKMIKENLKILTQKKLNSNYKSTIVECTLVFYLIMAHRGLKTKDSKNFLEFLICLRDSIRFFETSTQPLFLDSLRAVFRELISKIPWRTFIESYTRFLISNHFKSNYSRSISPFKEQKDLLQAMSRNEMCGFFVCPWVTGRGKTAMLPTIALEASHVGASTLYCVPYGTLRDQSAAYLYRCGTPFAYIVQTSSGWELQPSYHCSSGKMPTVFIVDPLFVRYYLDYWNKFIQLTMDSGIIDPKENPPNISIPNEKRRYAHINHSIWSQHTCLILDEPKDDPNIDWILANPPKTVFLMSATMCDLVDKTICENYEHKYGETVITIPANSIGVATTLVGYWLEDNPILSPFSGVDSKADFIERLSRLERNTMHRRFLSPEVFVEWLKIRKNYPDLNLNASFDFEDLEFDDISHRLVEWSQIISKNQDDDFFRKTFAFKNPKQLSYKQLFTKAFCEDSYMFTGGCVVVSDNVINMYKKISPQLEGFPTVEEITEIIDVNKRKIQEYFSFIKSIGKSGNKEEDRYSLQDQKLTAIKEAHNMKLSEIPVKRSDVINTPEYISKWNTCSQEHPKDIRYTRVIEIKESGNPEIDPESWTLYADIIQKIPSDYTRWRWKGVGSVINQKEHYMKCIRDSDHGFTAFLLVDDLGAHGLNLKISNGILCNGVSCKTAAQGIGRVGRPGQEESGHVYVMAEEAFTNFVDEIET